MIDRIQFAVELAQNKRVLDIGGTKMPNCDPNSWFARAYAQIETASGQYRVVDRQAGADYTIDLNQVSTAQKCLDAALTHYAPQVILCMETLEHLQCPHMVIESIAKWVARGGEVFITLPNARNWVTDALGWNKDHVALFFRDTGRTLHPPFTVRAFDVECFKCTGRYHPLWLPVYVLSGLQPTSFGFYIRGAVT